jgi:hypothetical protein
MAFAIPRASAQIYAEDKSKSVYLRSIIVAGSKLTTSRAEQESRKFLAATDDEGLKRDSCESRQGRRMPG